MYLCWSEILQFIHSEHFVSNAYKEHRYVTIECANLVEYLT